MHPAPGTALRIATSGFFDPAWLTAAALVVVTLIAVGTALITHEAHLGRRWLKAHPHPGAEPGACT